MIAAWRLRQVFEAREITETFVEINDLHGQFQNFGEPERNREWTLIDANTLKSNAWGARPSRSLRGASRAPLRQERKTQGCGWRDSNHGGRDDRAPQTSRHTRNIGKYRENQRLA